MSLRNFRFVVLCKKRLFFFSLSLIVALCVVMMAGRESLLADAVGGQAEHESRQISAEAFMRSEAGSLFQAGDYEKALPAIEGLLETYPGDALLIRYKAIALDRLGRFEEAISILERLVREEPTHIPPRYFLAVAKSHAGDMEGAVSEWKWITEQEEGSIYKIWSLTSLQKHGALSLTQQQQEVLRWFIRAEYGYELDSNVTLRPDDEGLASSRDHNSGRHTLSLDLRYRAYSRRDLSVDLLYGMDQTLHDDSLEEFNFHSEEFGIQTRKRIQVGNRDVIAGLRYKVDLSFLDNDLFSVRNEWYLSADTRFTPRSRTIFYDRMFVSDFGPDGSVPSISSRDGFYNNVGVTHYIYSKDFRTYVYGRTEFNSAHTRGSNFDQIGSTSRLGFHVPFWERIALDVSGGLSLSFYHGFSSQSTLDASRRRNVNWDIYSGLTYSLTPRIGLRGFYRFIKGDNQNNFFDYTRHIGGLKVIVNFSH